MYQIKDLFKRVLQEGELVETRSGRTLNIFSHTLHFDLRKGFPAVTAKKAPWNAVVGELLWFLSGSTDLRELKHYTFNDSLSSKWTIWSDDIERYNKFKSFPDNQEAGNIYGYQWRNYNGQGVDQIKDLIDNIKSNPTSRRHVVMAWNPKAVKDEEGCLPPCHMGFEVVIYKGTLNLKALLRSNDLFLGLSANIASYALLTHLLARWTGYTVGELVLDITNPHLYENHLEQVDQYLKNPCHDLPRLLLPDGTESLDSTLKLTAKDFKDALKDYKHSGYIKAPLSVG